MKLLLVEDDALLHRSLLQGLHEAGYVVDSARDGEEASHFLRTGEYDGAVLDWMLPKISGLEVLRRHRASGGSTPVLVLTARDAASDTVEALDAGADDYLVKPFEFAVLLARLRSLVRRKYQKSASSIHISDLEVDLARREVRRSGELIALTPREFSLLELLALNSDRVVSRREIWSRLYDEDSEGVSNTVDVYVSYLRRKIDRGRTPLIETRRGQGYMLRGERCTAPSAGTSSS